MNLEEALRKRKDFEAKLLKKILESDEYRKEFEANPRAAVEKEAGLALPDGVKIKLIDEDPNTIMIVVPPKATQAKTTGELTDEALEQVAGGGNVGTVVAAVSTLIVGVTAVA